MCSRRFCNSQFLRDPGVSIHAEDISQPAPPVVVAVDVDARTRARTRARARAQVHARIGGWGGSGHGWVGVSRVWEGWEGF